MCRGEEVLLVLQQVPEPAGPGPPPDRQPPQPIQDHAPRTGRGTLLTSKNWARVILSASLRHKGTCSIARQPAGLFLPVQLTPLQYCFEKRGDLTQHGSPLSRTRVKG